MLLLILVLGTLILLPPLNHHRPNESVPVWKIEIRNIASALESYRTELNSYPVGDSVLISKALRGDNPRKIVFFEARTNGINVKGELLDLWGTPYEIGIVGQINYIIRSAGSNCQLGDKDDHVFDSVKHEFIK